MIEKINIAIGDIFAKTLFGRRKNEPSPRQKPDSKIDPLVESLEYDQVTQLLPQVMTLARRRSCASEQIGQVNFAHERDIASLLANWYQLQGWKETDLPQVMQNDLAALFNPTPNPTTALQQRILLSNIGSQARDAYGYGQINPLLFQGNTQEVSFVDTLATSLDFPTRVQTIISFDKEPRGHKHQIRYFKALLSAYALADNLESQKMASDQTQILLDDRQSFATSWITFAQKVRTLGINPHTLTPDNNLLYSRAKVRESAYLFEIYDHIFINLQK